MFQVGGKVSTIENHRYLGITKDMIGTVTAVDQEGISVKFGIYPKKATILFHSSELTTLPLNSSAFVTVYGTISEENTPISNSAAKNDKDKIDLSLIPHISNLEHAKAFMVGERKYGRYNYTKGHTASQLIAALLRHAGSWNNGEETDPKDGQHHLGSVMACCSMILRQMELGTLKDDRYKPETK